MDNSGKRALWLGATLILASTIYDVNAQEGAAGAVPGTAIAAASAPGQEVDDVAGNALPQLIQEFALSETVYPQERGETQITISTVRSRNEDRVRDTSLKVEYGITDRLQFEAQLPHVSLVPAGGARESGIGDTGLGLSYNLRPGGGKRTAVSLGFEVTLPTGSEAKGLGGGTTTIEPSLVAARQVGKGQMHLSLGTELGSGERETSYNLAYVYPSNRKFYPTLELNGFRSEDEGNRLYLTPGAVVRVGRNGELGFGIPIGLRKRGEKLSPVGKFTIEF